jgi:hypothetical protein
MTFVISEISNSTHIQRREIKSHMLEGGVLENSGTNVKTTPAANKQLEQTLGDNINILFSCNVSATSFSIYQ